MSEVAGAPKKSISVADLVEKYIKLRDRRHEEVVEHDLYYIENWSIFFDMYIMLITPFAVLKGENAF